MKRLLRLSLFVLSCASNPKSPAVTADASQEEASPMQLAEPPLVKSTIRLSGSIDVLTVKNETAPVPLRIESFDASLVGTEVAPGSFEFEEAVILFPLADLSSGLDIRDQRIRDTFFHSAENPNAALNITRMTVDESSAKIHGTLVVGAFSHDINGVFNIVPAAPAEEGVVVEAEGMAVKSSEPMVILISTFGLGERLKALIELCAHQSIADAVEVTAQGTIAIVAMD